MLLPQSGKVALVTGASSGIGEAVARSLAAAGVEVVVSARRLEKLTKLVEEINREGGKAIAFSGDVSLEAEAFKIVDDTIANKGRIDILVNSAGIIEAGGLEDLTLDQWRRVIDTNLMGTIYICKAALPHMKTRREGDIINISSTAGRRAAGLMGAYSTSKFGMTGFSEGLRQELGDYGVRVSVVEPGATETEVAEGISDPAMRDAMRTHVSRECAMQPSDIAEAIMFIVSLPRRANVSQILIRPVTDTAPM